MYALADRLDPDSYRALARATFAEMVLAGITCVGEFHYLHHDPGGAPYDDPNAMGARCIAGGGARPAFGSRCSTPATCTAGIGEAPTGAQRRFTDGDAEAWARRVDELADGEPRRGSAPRSTPCAPSTRESTAVVAAWAASAARPLHAHVSEQPAENEECLAAHGRTPDGLLADAGVLSASGSPRSTPPTSPTTTSALLAAPRRAAASARRPSATSPTASARARRLARRRACARRSAATRTR